MEGRQLTNTPWRWKADNSPLHPGGGRQTTHHYTLEVEGRQLTTTPWRCQADNSPLHPEGGKLQGPTATHQFLRRAEVGQLTHDLVESGLTAASGALGGYGLLTRGAGKHVLRVARAVLGCQQTFVVLHRVVKVLHAVVCS